jgi:hypothetical protein
MEVSHQSRIMITLITESTSLIGRDYAADLVSLLVLGKRSPIKTQSTPCVLAVCVVASPRELAR